MNTKTKVKIANLTIWIMVITVALIILWFIGFAVSNTFDLTVFTNRTENFLMSMLAIAGVLIVCSSFLNISINISIVADSKVPLLDLDEKKSFAGKLAAISVGTIALVVIFLFLGDKYTRERVKSALISESEELVKQHQSSLHSLAMALNDTSLTDTIPVIVNKLENIKESVGTIHLIVAEKDSNDLFYYSFDGYLPDEGTVESSSYKCNNEESVFFEQVFAGQKKDPFFIKVKKNYTYFIPIVNGNKTFILSFSKYQSNGYAGS